MSSFLTCKVNLNVTWSGDRTIKSVCCWDSTSSAYKQQAPINWVSISTYTSLCMSVHASAHSLHVCPFVCAFLYISVSVYCMPWRIGLLFLHLCPFCQEKLLLHIDLPTKSTIAIAVIATNVFYFAHGMYRNLSMWSLHSSVKFSKSSQRRNAKQTRLPVSMALIHLHQQVSVCLYSATIQDGFT